MEVKNEIKAYLARKGITLKELAKMLNEKYQTNQTVATLSNKLSRGSIKYSEVHQIASVAGFKIEWVDAD